MVSVHTSLNNSYPAEAIQQELGVEWLARFP